MVVTEIGKWKLKREGNHLILWTMDKVYSPITVYMGKCADSDEIQEVVGSWDSRLFRIRAPKRNQPFYFQIEEDGKRSPIISERVYSLDGAINVRDCGGYETTDGRRVKWGLLLRGDQLNRLSDQDVEILNSVSLHTIVDYRSAHEQALNPNRKISSVVRSIQCDPQSVLSEAAGQASDLNDENSKLIQALSDGSIPKEFINSDGEQVIQNYRNLVTKMTSITAFKKMLAVYVDVENAPILQHCRGGKDRTGVGSALVLLTLGVKEEDILYDYRITELVRAERNEYKMKQYRELTSNQDYLDYLYSLIETRTTYLKAALVEMKNMSGSYDTYIRDVMGLSEEDITKMREYYLEEVK